MVRGNSPARIDDKGRLKIPSLFRGFMEDERADVFVTSLRGDCVWIYPMAAWNAIEQKLANAPRTLPARNRYLDRVNYYGQMAEIDKQGRVLIHPLLRESAQMDGEVVVLGKVDHLEVWNHERFKAERLTQDFSVEDARELAPYL